MDPFIFVTYVQSCSHRQGKIDFCHPLFLFCALDSLVDTCSSFILDI